MSGTTLTLAASVAATPVGVSLAVQGDSASTWGLPLFIGLLVAGLFGLAAYKLTQSRIALKGLILISVPLIFVLAFVLLVLEVKRQNEQAQSWYLHSKEVIAQTDSISRSLADAEASIRGYVITGDPSFDVAYSRAAEDIPEGIRRLQTLVRDNPAQEASAARVGARAAEKMAFLARVERMVVEGHNAQAIEEIRSGKGLSLMEEFRRELERFLEAEQQLDRARRKSVEESWQRFNRLLITGASIDILLTLMLAALFTRGISKRVRALTKNARALAEGRELTKIMKGTDEIAHLDRVFHDMARALREAARKERSLVENSLDVICSIDAEGKFVEVSPASYKVWGYLPEELIGRRYIDLVVPEDVEKTNLAAARIMDGHALTDFENCYLRKDGSRVHITWSAFWSETERLMYCVARDNSERKEAERLAERGRRELEKMAANLTAANKELEAFSYSVSHDLRAPLRAIDGFSRILLEDYADKFDEEGRRVLGVIRNNTQNMGRLIDDLLAFSRFGRKPIEPSTIDVGELARDVFVQLETYSDKTPRLEIKPTPVAYGDRALMRQVFINLLSNAAKYSNTAASPVIEVGGRERGGENLYYVKDNGVGFDMKYVNKLFGVFQRLHSHEEFEGTGVGLAIVRRIVERHGGRVWAEGKTGEGATFYFTLPKNGERHDGQLAQ